MQTVQQKPHPRPRLVLPAPADAQLLHAVQRYHAITARQLTTLLYAPSSHTWVQTKLKRLTDAGYLQRLFLPRPSQAGSAPSVYTLSRRGMRYLADHGVDVPRRARPYKARSYTYLHLSHLLAVNDVLIAAELLARRHPQVVLARLLHERDLQRMPVTVQNADGT